MKNIVLAMLILTCTFSAHSSEKRIQFGAQSYTDGSKYDVGFCARSKDMSGKGPGHAFVVFRKYDSTNKLVDFYTLGLAPGGASVPYTKYGLIKPEMYSHPSQKCLVADTSKKQYETTLDYARTFQEFKFGGVTFEMTNTYIVAINDCVTYMGDVAKHFGLNVPSRIKNMMPMSFVEGLIKKNN